MQKSKKIPRWYPNFIHLSINQVCRSSGCSEALSSRGSNYLLWNC